MSDRYLVTIAPVLDFESGGKAVLSAETWNLTEDQQRQLQSYLGDLTLPVSEDQNERNPARYRALKEHLERMGVDSPEWVAMHALYALGFMTETGGDTPEALYRYRVDDVRQRRHRKEPEF